MKKSFMTRVLAVSLSAAMAFSMSSASNLMTASAASTVNLKTTFKTLKVKQTYKMTLKNNTLNWKITKVQTTNKKICTVYGKTASSVMLKGKGVGRAKITVKVKTTKRKYPKNIKEMKCTVNVKAADDSNTPSTAFSAYATASSNTEVRVTFNQEIDTPEASNFTVSDGVTVSEAKLSTDKKSVVLTIAGAEYGKNYDLTVSGIKVAGKEQAEQKLTFTTPAATEKYPMTLEAKDKILKSDGQSQTVVTFTIKDENGNPITDKGVEVAFTTSLGKFAEQRVSIQNGVATVMYTSEALMQTQTAAITATVVESQDNQELMGLTTSSSITLTPNPEALNDTSIGAIITSATAPTADRVIAYFNQKVEAKDFKTASGKVDRSKFTCTVQSGLDNGFAWVDDVNSKEHSIVGILDVPGDDNALQLLVNEPMIDNTNVKVEFENKTKSDSLVSAKNTVFFKLTDAHQPSVLNVTGDGLRKVTIEFSEAVLPSTYCDGKNGSGDAASQRKFAADNFENYTIDGLPLDTYWNVNTTPATLDGESEDSTDGSVKKISQKVYSKQNTDEAEKGQIKVGSYKDGKDTRHVVEITVGRDRYISPGTHSLSISNVGDWAAKTDKERNIVNTQNFDFVVESNDVIPTFTVQEQSPEQYLLSFNADVIPVSGETLRTENSQFDPSVIKLQQKVGNDWVDISDGSASGKNPIMVSQIDDTRNYVVEVRKDWTEVYNTSGTRANYFNYELRLHVDANKLINTANNKQNAAIDVNLDGTVMRSADVVSPVIGEVIQAEDTNGNLLNSYNVTMSEPVKLSDGSDNKTGANKEGVTPSQTQRANATATAENGVPMPSAQFISANNQTVEGIIASNVFIDATDTTINVEPATPLSAGEWRLVLSSISDDYGNTASTVATTINVTAETVVTDFRVVWAAVSTRDDKSTLAGNIKYDPNYIGKNPSGSTRGRYIFVKFNKPITMSGNSVNAGVTGNYTINGATLPTGTQIRANIADYDDHDGVTDSITIILPEGNVNTGSQVFTVDATNAMLNISRAITSTTGETLTNGGMIRLPFQYGSADAVTNSDYIKSLTTATDAVWGNDPSEQYGSGDKNIKTLKEYYQKLKSALESEAYRRVIISQNLNLADLDGDKDLISVFGRSRTLTINRAVDIDLTNTTITGNVVVSTTDAVDKIRIYSEAVGGAKINGYNESNDDGATLTVNAGSARDFEIQGVTVTKGTRGNAVNINDTYKASFHNKGTIDGNIRITDTNGGAGFTNEGTLQNGSLVIDTDAEVNLNGDLTGLTDITVNRAAKLTFGNTENTDISRLDIHVSGAGARVIFTADVTAVGTDFIAEAKNVRVELKDPALKDTGNIKFMTDNGEIITVDKDNKEVSTDKIVTEATGVQKALDNLNVLTGIVGDTTSTTITAGAISNGALNTETIASTIRASIKGAEDVPSLNDNDISVNYRLQSTNNLTQSGSIISVKDKLTENSKDEIRVVVSCKGYSVTKYIVVKDK